ncbi:hypothetical protein [Pseudonocardia alni]|uniref:Citrate synthase n=1 Tax=Pseudonocardia alni TaxID=33907 RepID=A0A852WC65_PSEA5|nr:hypothetical protein [Pseudonocardia antarctica]NYG04881.1 citrate synthase [Pseudonocardia antarctica]
MGRRANFRIQQELARANALHERAEVMRRAAMTPAQRAEADYVFDVQRVREEGERQARQRANQVLALGFVAGLVLAALTAPWVWFVVMVAAAVGAWATHRARILELSDTLETMRPPLAPGSTGPAD